MASSSPKQLWEHLREQQEPFILHIYIPERIESKSNHSTRGCKCNTNKGKFYTKNILKLMLCKSIRQLDLNSHEVQKHNLISKMTRKLWWIRGSKSFDIGSSAAYHDLSMCSTNRGKPALHLSRKSQNNKHGGFIAMEVATDINKLRESDENKQLEARSFSDEAPTSSIGCQSSFSAKGGEDDESNSSTILTKNAAQDSMTSACLSKTEKLNHANFMESQGEDSIGSSGFLKLSGNKSALQHSEYEKCTIGYNGLEEVENFWSVRNQKLIQNITFDDSNVIEDWNHMHKTLEWKIVIEIGDAIMHEMIHEIIDLIFV